MDEVLHDTLGLGSKYALVCPHAIQITSCLKYTLPTR